jgi:ELWxxDGT repeat protein
MADKGGNSLAKARLIRASEAGRVYTDQVGPGDRNDYFRLRLARRSYLVVTLRDLSANADLELRNAGGQLFRLRDSTGRLKLSRSRNPGKSSEILEFPVVERGTYFIRVNARASTTRYRLKVAAVPRIRFGDTSPQQPVTELFSDFNPDGDAFDPEQSAELTVVGNRLFFVADRGEGSGRELYSTDGTRSGNRGNITLVSNINETRGEGSDPRDLVDVNGVLYFTADDGDNGRELYRSDGTRQGTQIVRDLNPGEEGSNPTDLVNLDGVLYFAADNGDGSGRELYRSDGTPEGTQRAVDINLGEESSNPTDLVNVNGVLYFAADRGDSNGRELYRSDGTVAGTQLVRDINIGENDSNPQDLIAVNDVLYFTANDGENGREVYRSDGTFQGTQRISDINPGIDSSLGSEINADPTLPGINITRAPQGSSRSRLVADANGVLYFAATADTQSGVQLWRSDGTVTGAEEQVTNITPDGGELDPSDIALINDTFYFAANSTNGRELWRSSGTPFGASGATPGGAEFVSNINSGDGGNASSDPAEFTLLGSTLFFVATTADSGRELRTLTLPTNQPQ